MSRIKNSAFIIGCRASGKTSFLTGLCILSRPGKKSPFSLVINDEPTARFVADLKKIVDRGDWPPPTADMVLLDFEVIFRHRSFPLSLLDYPGEDLLDAMETMNFENKEQIEQHIRAAEIILVLLDPTQDMISTININPERTRRRQDALAMAVGKLAAIRADAGLPLPIIGLLITKADLVEGDQMDKLKADNTVLMSKLAHCARQHKLTCLPLSASGAIPVAHNADAPSAHYPEDPDPKGYEALFNWVGLQLDVRRNRRYIFAVGAAILTVAVALTGFSIFQSASHRNIAGRIDVENVETISQLVNKPRIPRRVAHALDDRGVKEFEMLQTRKNNIRLLEQIISLADASELWSKVPHLANRSQFENLYSELKTQEDNARFNAVEDAHSARDNEQTLLLISEYLGRFPAGGHNTTEILEIRDRIMGETKSRLRSEIRSIPITSRDSLSTKTAKISDFLSKYPNEQDHHSMHIARDLASRLASADTIRIVLLSCGYEWHTERHHEIQWFVRNNPIPNMTHRSSVRGYRSTVRDLKLDVRIGDWNDVRADFLVRSNFYQFRKTSEISIRLLHSLSVFNGTQKHWFDTSIKGWEDVRPWMIAEVHIPASGGSGFEQIRPNQLQAYADFIYPGNKW